MWPFPKRVSFEEARKALADFDFHHRRYLCEESGGGLYPGDPYPPVYWVAETVLRLMLRREPTPAEVRALYEVPGLDGSGGN
jgi:hypothetical protein